jgi:hypothetical protein
MYTVNLFVVVDADDSDDEYATCNSREEAEEMLEEIQWRAETRADRFGFINKQTFKIIEKTTHVYGVFETCNSLSSADRYLTESPSSTINREQNTRT